jgi:hypothetical protein
MPSPAEASQPRRPSNKRKTPFAVRYKGRDLWSWPVEKSHILYSQELHWRLAARWNRLTWKKFIALEGDEQSRLVATYETSLQMEAVVSKDSQKKARNKVNRK